MLCIIYIKRKVPELNLGKAWFVFDGTLLKQTILYGWTSAMQQGTVQLGKISVQAIANTMGVSVMAAYTIVNRIDDFACLPEQNIAHSMTSFMAQNSGAGKKDRVRKGFWGGMKIELVYGMIIFLVCFFFAEPVVRLFVSDTDVVKEGVTYLKLISFMYLLPAVTNGIQGYFRGIGDLKITLISSMVNMGVRVLAAFVFVFGFAMKVETFPFACLAGWIAMLITEVPLFSAQLWASEARRECCDLRRIYRILDMNDRGKMMEENRGRTIVFFYGKKFQKEKSVCFGYSENSRS